MRVYTDWSRYTPEGRTAIAGPPAYRVLRGWLLLDHERVYGYLRMLTMQRQVVEGYYNLEPDTITNERIRALGYEIANSMAQEGYPAHRIRQIRDLADPMEYGTLLYDNRMGDPRAPDAPTGFETYNLPNQQNISED